MQVLIAFTIVFVVSVTIALPVVPPGEKLQHENETHNGTLDSGRLDNSNLTGVTEDLKRKARCFWFGGGYDYEYGMGPGPGPMGMGPGPMGMGPGPMGMGPGPGMMGMGSVGPRPYVFGDPYYRKEDSSSIQDPIQKSEKIY